LDVRNLLTLCVLLSLQACATNPNIVTIPPAACAKLVPQGWREGVEAAPVPENAPGLTEWLGKPLTAAMAAAIIAPWASGYVAMSGQLTKANGRTADAMEIQSNCEALVNDARG
jgi:hypothetical protein